MELVWPISMLQAQNVLSCHFPAYKLEEICRVAHFSVGKGRGPFLLGAVLLCCCVVTKVLFPLRLNFILKCKSLSSVCKV